MKSSEVNLPTTCTWDSKPMKKMIQTLDVAEEVAEAVVVAAVLSRLVAEDKMPSRLLKRLRRTSPPYEVTDS